MPRTSRLHILGSDSASRAANIEGSTFGGWDARILSQCIEAAGIPQHSVEFSIANDRTIDHLNANKNLEVIVPLGSRALYMVTGQSSLEKYQLSPLDTVGRINCPKAVASYTPNQIKAQYNLKVYLTMALARAKEGMAYPGKWKRKKQNFIINPPLMKTLELLSFIKCKEHLAVDFECGAGIINTVGFAWSERDAIAIGTRPEDYTELEYMMLWNKIAGILEAPQIKKILQNNIFEDMYCSKYGIKMANVWHDTMWAQRVLWPEFKVGLGNVGRMYTSEVYWKDDGKSEASEDKKDWHNIKDWHRHYEYNCLAKGTKVYTSQGILPIDEIVKKKLKTAVISWNINRQKFEFKPVTNWLLKKHAEKIDWVRLDFYGSGKRGKLLLTPDHEVLTPSGWLAAEKLKVHDVILNRGMKHNFGTLLGTVLGDSSLSDSSSKDTAYLQCSQIHKDLINLKRDIFGGTITESFRETGYGSNTFYTLYVPATWQLKIIKKLNPVEHLDKLNSLGLALWYMDDGCKQKGKNPHCKLALQAFKLEERKQILKFFKARYGETGSLDSAGNLNMALKMSRKFCIEIGPFVPEQLRYKLPCEAPDFDMHDVACYKSLLTNIPNQIKSIERGVHKQHGYMKTSYCISVANNENFLTEFGIVANCKDTSNTYEAAFNQKEDLRHRGMHKFFYGYVMQMAPAISEMCSRGLPVNEPIRQKLETDTQLKIDELLKGMSEPINHRSSKQKLELFKAKGYVIPKKRKSDGSFRESLDELSLKKLRLKYGHDEDIKILLKTAKLEKALSSYIKFNYHKDGNVRFMMNGCGTETLRFSSSLDPWDGGFNAQTIPSDFKCIFPAPEGFTWVNVDLKQAESRYVAYACGDTSLIEMLESPDKDVHKFVAAHIFNIPENEVNYEQRQLGKKSGHGANYSMAATTFMESCLKEMDLVLSKKEASNVLETYHKLFPGIRMGQERTRALLRERGWLENPFGYRRYFYGRLDDNTFREAYAFEPQSSIPTLTNYLMLHLLRKREIGELNFRLHLQVHDSLLMLCAQGQETQLMDECLDTAAWHPELNMPAGKLIIPTETAQGTELNKLTEYTG